MTTGYLKPKYGAYLYTSGQDFPSSFTSALAGKMRTATPPEVDGDFTAGALLAARKCSLKGALVVPVPNGAVQTDQGTLRGLWDDFKAAHAPGAVRPLWVDTDRYLNAEVESLSEGEWSRASGPLRHPYEVGFLCADPYWYAGDPATPYTPLFTSANLAAGGANVPVTNTSQLATPTAAPVLTSTAAGTALTVGTYKVAASYRDLFGETQVSPVGSVTIAAGDHINVASLTLPAGATLINLYMSIAAGSLTLAWVKSLAATGATTISALPAGPNSATVTPGGNATSLPIITLPVTAAPAGGLVYVDVSSSQGDFSFTLSPNGTGSYVIDCTRFQEAVTLAGADVTSLFAGAPPILAGASVVNTIVVGLTGGVTVGTCTVQWQDRWL